MLRTEPASKSSSTNGAMHRVCPFCGSINTKPGKPCPRCTLEDTPATRSATKARIGPWYVLQTRNPAAPGMKFQTLQVLIRKGLVTPQSVVRGPTTTQLWQSAAKVKGISREFGVCYSCGGDIDSSDTLCPNCNRSQSLPTEVDALLDLPAPLPPTPAEPAVMPLPETPKAAEEPKSIIEPLPDLSARLPANSVEETIAPPAAENEPAREVNPPAEPVVVDRPLQKPPSPDVLSPRELAMVFQLGYDAPSASKVAVEPPPSRDRFKNLATSSALIILSFGIIYWMFHHGHSGPPMARASAVQQMPPLPPNPRAVELPPHEIHLQAVPSGVEMSPVASTDNPLPPASPPDEAAVLWKKALDAESHRDFATAIKMYQHIENLPSDAWPSGLVTRLHLAQQELAAGTY